MLLNIILIVAALFVASLVWTWIANHNPIKYRQVTLAGLEEHFDQYLRRGFRHSMMHVIDETTHRKMLIRKWYDVLMVGYDAYVIFDGFTEDSPAAAKFLKSFDQKTADCGYGLARPRKYRAVLACKCEGDPKVAFEIAQSALFEVYKVAEDATFTVYVMGAVENGDITHHAHTSVRRSTALTLSCNWGKPYLKDQRSCTRP